MGEFEAKKAKNSLRRGNDRVPTLDSTETHVKMSTGHMGFLEPISLPPWTVHSPAVPTIPILTMRSKMREKVRPMFTVCFSLYTTIRMYSDVGTTMRTKEMVLNALFVYVGNGEKLRRRRLVTPVRGICVRSQRGTTVLRRTQFCC